MLEIEPKSYLERVVNGKFKRGEPYVWHRSMNRENAIDKAKQAVLSEYNGWPAQTEKLKKEILGLVVQDRCMGICDFINSIGGRAKMFAVVNDLKGRVISSLHDWILKPVDSHDGLVPAQVGLMAAKLRQNGYSFDDYLVAEPVAKPALPKPADPVLVGALGSPIGFFLVEVGRWDSFIRGNNFQYNVELSDSYKDRSAHRDTHDDGPYPSGSASVNRATYVNQEPSRYENRRWMFAGISLVVWLFFIFAVKGGLGCFLGIAAGIVLFILLDRLAE